MYRGDLCADCKKMFGRDCKDVMYGYEGTKPRPNLYVCEACHIRRAYPQHFKSRRKLVVQ
jgi:hypothetical protein